MKKLLALLLSVVMVLALVACAAPAAPAEPAAEPAAATAAPAVEATPEPAAPAETAAPAEPGKVFKVAVSLPPANNAWQAKLLEYVNAEAAKDTDQFEFTVKNANDDNDQLATLETFKDQGFDMILILPGNGTLLTPICESIFDAGIPTMIIDRGIDSRKFTTFVEGDNYGCGVAAANYIGKRLGGKGDVVVLRSYVGIPIDLDRYNGFVDTVKKYYPDIKIIAEGDGEFNREAGLKAMSDLLLANPKIDAVYCHDDEAALGAINAIKNAGRTDVQFVTGMGGTTGAYDMMKEKDPIYGASISYYPSMGATAVMMAKKILKGEGLAEAIEKDFPFRVILRASVVTQDNVDKFYDFRY